MSEHDLMLICLAIIYVAGFALLGLIVWRITK